MRSFALRKVQTFVVKLDGDVCTGQQSLRDVLIVEGRSPGAYALVHLDEFSSEPGLSMWS